MNPCSICGGTRLPPARSGAERGTCSCRRPGQLISHLLPQGNYSYEVYFEGTIYTVEPPTLSAAYAKLEELRDQLPLP